MTLSADAGTIAVAPRPFPTSGGGLCQKGWTAADLLHSPERLTAPLVRLVPGDRTSPPVPVGWDEACVQAGARSVEEVAAATRATTGCGTCRGVVAGLVGWLTAPATPHAQKAAS